VLFWVVGVFLLLVYVCPLQATIVSFDVSWIYSGNGVPTNPPPWLNATFDDGGSSGSVDLTITLSGLTVDEKVWGVWLNLDPKLDPTKLVFSDPIKTGDFEVTGIGTGFDKFQADGDGMYDIRIEFDQDGLDLAFNGGEAVKYTITLPSLTASSFDFVSAPDGGQGEYKIAAHLQNLGTTGDSAWATIPEPATLFLLVAGAAAALRRRNR
jgi:hypothetical protein